MATQYGIRFKAYTANGISINTQVINHSGWTNDRDLALTTLIKLHGWRNNNPEFPELSAYIVEREYQATQRPPFKSNDNGK